MHEDLMNTIETHIDKTTIQAIAQLIVERFNPEQVILFGSHARGEVGEHSDVDLLVVLHDDARQSQRGNPIRRAIAERFVLPVDVIICSPEVLATQRNDPYSFIHKVLKEGEVLYERRAA
jgi:predicted nucleotidyltransferase